MHKVYAHERFGEPWGKKEYINTTKMESIKCDFLKTLEQARGIVKTACEAMGITRKTYYDWYNSDAEFRAAAGMVNGVSTAVSGIGSAQPTTIILQTADGQALARWLLPDLRAASRANPEVAMA